MRDPFTVAAEHGPGRGPGPVVPSRQRLVRLLATHRMGVLATLKQDGSPHLTTMAYAWSGSEQVIRISSVAGRIKVRHLEHTPRAAFYVTSQDHLEFAVAEGDAEVSPPSTAPGDETGRELLAMQESLPAADEAAFLKNMVADQRLVIRLPMSHLYGGGLDVTQPSEGQ
ncbi:MAG: TIGR03618 family F420-dependent PPOX class oxidoreductase [Actinopolymorphaceae bacterium]